MAYREVKLDERGLDFVLGHLRGANRLCDGLSRAVETASGHVFTAVPDDAKADHIYDFEIGGLLPENLDMSRGVHHGLGSLMQVADLAVLRANLILETLSAYPEAVCLCDDFNPRWSEGIARSTPNAFGVGDETYHLLTAQSGIEVIANTLRFTDTVWHGVAAICLQHLHRPPSRKVEPEALADCALSVVELTCTAYDREGFIGWRRYDR